MLTYGDGVCDVNINELVKFHQSHGKIATMTSVSVGQRFGVLDIDENNTIVHSAKSRILTEAVLMRDTWY